MKGAARYVPWVIVGLGTAYLIGAMSPPRSPDNQMNLAAFAAIPVQDRGRIKPIDTYARVQLMLINNRQDYTDESGKSGQLAVRWFLNLVAYGLARFDAGAPIVIADKEVRAWYGLPEPENPARPYYRLKEVLEAAHAKKAEVARLFDRPETKLTPVEKQILRTAEEAVMRKSTVEDLARNFDKLGNPNKTRVLRIENDQVLNMLGLKPREGLRYSTSEIPERDTQEFDQLLRKAVQAKGRSEKERDLIDVKVLELFSHMQVQEEVEGLDSLRMVPPARAAENWTTFRKAMLTDEGSVNPAARTLETMLRAYSRGDVKTFNQEVLKYQDEMAKQMPAETRMARLEAWFNNFAPFYRCLTPYVLVFLLACVSWIFRSETLNRSAFWLCVTVVVVHTLALVLRMYLQGRPPVTNLYSSAVFIGWLGVLLCLVIEALYRNGLGCAVGAALGFSTLIIAHHLAAAGDTLEMMQAVLDTNFWLATHVTTVTFGYTATFVAGFIAIGFLWLMLATAVVAFFRKGRQAEWSSPSAFVASVCGLVAIPAVILILMAGGLSYVYLPDDLEMVVPIAATPILLAAGVFGGVVCKTWFSAAPRTGVQTALPDVVAWLEPMTLTAETSKALATVIYGVICFATMLSFIGTVLGGIWADQSWGRFWGWDPKENGAVLIVIMNALILHARWGGLIKERGLVTLALVGNVITMWSWFGTNQLGIGLHAYGFNKALVKMCTLFWFSQIVLIGLAVLPLKYWRSYSQLAPLSLPKVTEPKPVPGPGKRGSTNVVPAS